MARVRQERRVGENVLRREKALRGTRRRKKSGQESSSGYRGMGGGTGESWAGYSQMFELSAW